MFNKVLTASNLVQRYGLRIGGYLFDWGTDDENAIRWTRRTNYGIGWYGHYPIVFQHGQNKDVGLGPIGIVHEFEDTDKGLRIGGNLFNDNPWYEAICTLQERGDLIWKAIPSTHLCKSESGVWINYPIVAFSIEKIVKETPETPESPESVNDVEGEDIQSIKESE